MKTKIHKQVGRMLKMSKNAEKLDMYNKNITCELSNSSVRLFKTLLNFSCIITYIVIYKQCQDIF